MHGMTSEYDTLLEPLLEKGILFDQSFAHYNLMSVIKTLKKLPQVPRKALHALN